MREVSLIEKQLHDEISILHNEILNLEQNNRLIKNGSKQLCEEIKLLIKDRETLQAENDKLKYQLEQLKDNHVCVGELPY